MSQLVPAVFVDRDGVLNRVVRRQGRPYPPKDVDELVLEDGCEEACRALTRAGLPLVCVTNQPDVARGLSRAEDVAAINDALRQRLGLRAVRACLHDDTDGCSCRKPRPGLLLGAARELGIDLSASVMVGDRWRDVEAGRAAGCRTVFLDRGYDERRPEAPDHVCGSLLAAVPWILGGRAA